jgi:RNA polymerase sigma factor (sigma-70 family)
MDRSEHELRDEFLRLLDDPSSRGGDDLWHAVWRLFVEHPWYQSELHHAALRVLATAGLHFQWADDVKQQAMLLLARRLRHSPDLHVDRALAADRFAGWLATIIAHHCRDAARSMRRAQRRAGLQQRVGFAAPSRPLPIDLILDLRSAIRKLPKELRRVLTLRLRGCGIAEISRQLRMSQTGVHRALKRVLSRLRQRG